MFHSLDPLPPSSSSPAFASIIHSRYSFPACWVGSATSSLPYPHTFYFWFFRRGIARSTIAPAFYYISRDRPCVCVCVRVTNISALEPIRSIGGRNKNIVQIVFSLYRPSSSIYLFVCFYFSFVFSLEEIRNFFWGESYIFVKKTHFLHLL